MGKAATEDSTGGGRTARQQETTVSRPIHLTACIALAMASSAAAARDRCDGFSELSVRLEQNATDGDSEVVLFAKGQDEGLRNLVVLAPDRRRVVANVVGAPDGVGLREFVFESAEPPDLDAVLAAFPRGSYFFFGVTMSGRCLMGAATLSHALAPDATLLTPEDEQIVPVDQVTLRWMPVPGAVRYIVELNNEDTGAEYLLDVFPPTTQLAIPAEFLVPGSEYQFVVGVDARNGNRTFVERTFFTGP